MGTLEPSRTNETYLGLPVYRNYGTRRPGTAIKVAKICADLISHDELWSMAFEFEPEDQFIDSHSSFGTSCPTSAKWGKHDEIAETSFRSSFRDLSLITIKCSSGGQGTVPTGGVECYLHLKHKQPRPQGFLCVAVPM